MEGSRLGHLPLVVGGNATHVIMHSGKDGDWLLSDIHAREDHGRLRDARQAYGQLLRGQVMQLQVHMVLLRAAASGGGGRHGGENGKYRGCETAKSLKHIRSHFSQAVRNVPSLVVIHSSRLFQAPTLAGGDSTCWDTARTWTDTRPSPAHTPVLGSHSVFSLINESF